MSFKEQLKQALDAKLHDGATGLLESVDEFAKEAGLTEQENTQVVTAISKYVDSANAKLVEAIIEEAATKVEAYAKQVEINYTEKEQKLTEAAEQYSQYLENGATQYGKYLKEQYEASAEEYIQKEVIPTLSETVDSYMAIMAAKLESEGAKSVNVIKAARFDQLVEALGTVGVLKPINESEVDEVAELKAQLQEAKDTIKEIGIQLKESETKYRKAKRQDVIAELTEGLSDLQKERVIKLANRLDESAEDFEDTVKDIVESIKSAKVNKGVQQEPLHEAEDGKDVPADSQMLMYAKYAKTTKTRLI